MTRRPLPNALRAGPFLGRDAIDAGLLTRTQLRSTDFRRVLHGVYVTSGSRVDHGLRCDAAGLLLPGEAALTGHSAAWWYGVRYAPPDASVLVAMPERVRRDGVRGIRIHRTPLAEGDVMIAGGKRLATPVRAAWDSATLIRGDEAVVLIDGMLQAGLLMTADLLARAQARRGAWGVAHFRAAVDLADPNAESPQETRTRLLACCFHGDGVVMN